MSILVGENTYVTKAGRGAERARPGAAQADARRQAEIPMHRTLTCGRREPVAVGWTRGAARTGRKARAESVAELGFSCRRGWQRILAFDNGFLAGILQSLGFGGILFDARFQVRRHAVLGINRFHGAF